MSGFLSSGAEKALMGDAEEAKRLFGEDVNIPLPYVDEDSNWAHAHTSASGLDYFHPEASLWAISYLANPYAANSSVPVSYAAGLPGGLAAAVSSNVPTTSTAFSAHDTLQHPPDLYEYGFLNADQRTWRCAYPGCTSKAIFVRPCDLRKHFHRHSKEFFCRYEGCPQSTEGGFSSKKDRLRHEAKHNPGVHCEWDGCERIFSRTDNMKDHVRRVHRKGV